MKKMLTFCLIMTFVLSFFGCTKKEKTKNEPEPTNTEEVSIDVVLPQTAYFKAVRKQLTGVDWKNYILQDSISYDKSEGKTVWAYKMGCLLTNCGFASAIKEEVAVKRISDDILRLAQQAGIVDEDVVIQIMDIIQSFDALIKEENYKEISNKIKEIEAILRRYYTDKSDEGLVKIVKFSSWLEAFYIVSWAIKDNYRAELNNLFNRGQEVKYFKNLLKKEELIFDEMKFLNDLGTNIENKDAIDEKKVNDIYNDISVIRAKYLK